MDRSTILGTTVPCHLAQGGGGRWPVGCLFPIFTSGAKLLSTQTDSMNLTGFKPGTGQQLMKDSNSQPNLQLSKRY